MQDRYVGDTGDFGKLGLLRAIARQGLRIGVNWYLTQTGKFEESIGDGRHRISDACVLCDPELATSLRAVFDGRQHLTRSVASLESATLIPNAIYYSRLLKPPTCTEFSREEWHRNALASLSECDAVFLDPDNGKQIKSVGNRSQRSVKYAFDREIVDYYQRGQSVIFYNHRGRINQSVYMEDFERFFRLPGFGSPAWYALTYHKGTLRDYFILTQPKHRFVIQTAVDELLNSKWSGLFTRTR